jgi:ATP-binding cassette subfamily F protein 3
MDKEYGIIANNFSLSVNSSDLILNSKWSIYPKRKVALIGDNGSGKSLLFDTIYNLYNKDKIRTKISGDISFITDTKLSYFPQNIQLQFEGTLEEYINLCTNRSLDLYYKYKNIDNIDNNEQSKILDLINTMNLWDFENRLFSIMDKLDIPNIYLNKNIKDISGGESTKIALIGVLLSDANILLLDEPTNNLDNKGVRFLIDYINDFKYSIFLISHDRYFLDETISEILEINNKTKSIDFYSGNYSYYLKEKERYILEQKKLYLKQEKKKKELKKTEVKLKTKANKIELKSKNAHFRSVGAKVANKSSILHERINRDFEKLLPIENDKKSNIEYINTNLEGNVYTLKNIYYKDIIENISFKIDNTDRIAIIGNNGIGKTTIAKLLYQIITPNNGTIYKNEKFRIYYLPQNIEINNFDENITDYIRSKTSIDINEIETFLGKILFQNPNNIKISHLSFGEIRRLELLSIFIKKPDFLILDEPTNYLDIKTIIMLENILNKYNGGMVVVSHDTRFIENININKIIKIRSKNDFYIYNINENSNIEKDLF